MTTGLCPKILQDGPRKGQVCGRRFMVGDACEKHRAPPPPRAYRPLSPEKNREQRLKRARARARAGVPDGWAV